MRKELVKGLLGAAAIAGLVALPTQASATTLEGVLDVNGAVIVTGDSIDFEPLGLGTGLENITDTSTFAVDGVVVTAGANLATTKDLAIPPNVAPNALIGEEFVLDFFQTLHEFPTLNFQLNYVATCGELGVQFACPVLGSPFGFAEASVLGVTNTTVTMAVSGLVWDTADLDPLIYNWTGIYTAQFPGQTIAQVLAEFNAAGMIDASFSASKIVIADQVIPEPATLLLLGSGLFGAAVRARRKNAKKA